MLRLRRGNRSCAPIRMMWSPSVLLTSSTSGSAVRRIWSPPSSASSRPGRRTIPGYSSILACRSFAQEEAGNYLAAEPSGRRAIELDPGDLWAAHAVAHVMEMQGRRSEGIQWLTTLAPNWEGAHNLQHHLWWHCALFTLE